jgi:hypothetical protein
MTPVNLKALLACRERLGITQVIEPPGVVTYTGEVLSYPGREEGRPALSPRTIVILPPEVRVASGSESSGGANSPFPFPYPAISCAALSEAPRLTERIRQYSERTRTPVFSSRYDAALLHSRLIALLGELGERRVVVHGVLVQVGGVGVLITGESGIGKTACGVELVNRGALWVADDVVVLQGRGTSLYGSGHRRVRNWIALRGRGLLRAETLLGKKALLAETRVDCVIRLGRSGCETVESARNRWDRRIAEVPLTCWSVAADDPHRTAGRVIEIVGRLPDS